MSSIPITHLVSGSLSGHSTFIAESIRILYRRQIFSPSTYFPTTILAGEISTSRLVGSRSIHRRQELWQSSSHVSSHACPSPVAVPEAPMHGWCVSDPPATGFSHLVRLPLIELRSSLVLPYEASIFVFCPFLSPIVLFFGLF